MSAHCCNTPSENAVDQRYRRILWIALIANASMFFVEMGAGALAGSTALLADAIDFFGDAANYGVSLLVLGLIPVWRSRAALLKGITMGIFGLFVLGKSVWNTIDGTIPEPLTMGVIAILALCTNLGVAWMLYQYRRGDANMRSVWLCSRNDAIGNVAVLLAALGVFGTSSGLPDTLVAAGLGLLAMAASKTVVAQALDELRLKTKSC